MPQKKTIAFVDDHPVLVSGVAAIFADDDEFQVIAKGGCADEAIEICALHRPDVIVIDLNMPGDVFAAIADISRTSPRTRILAYTASVEIDIAVKTLRSGASGYVVKGSSAEELRDGIIAVLGGETFVTRGLAGKVLTALANQIGSASATKLSTRETQVVRLLYRGCTNREIAESLKISEKTVKHYMTILMNKLNVRNRLEVVMAAQQIIPHLATSTREARARVSAG
jgi:DNA-binding NarL/FixJ family response regulator